MVEAKIGNKIYSNDPKRNFYLCVDFDGTLVDHAFPEIGKEVPKAFAWLTKFQDMGIKIILFTVRGSNDKNPLQSAVNHVKERNINLFAVNENPDQKEWSNSGKVYANVYIDDSAVGVPLLHLTDFQNPCVNWDAVGPLVVKEHNDFLKVESSLRILRF